MLLLSLRLLDISTRHVLQAEASYGRSGLCARLAQRFERLKATYQIRLAAALPADAFNIDVKLFTGLYREILAAVNLCLLIDALLKFVVLDI